MATYLDEILAVHRARAAADGRNESALAAAVDELDESDAPRQFAAALSRSSDLAVIAEVKRRSPSAGALALDLDPGALAATYERAGAACLSVLTDGPHFGGCAADLIAARRATRLPVLRKDFTIDRRDIYDARLMGADAVLLIVAALDDRELTDFLDLANRLRLDALVEVHDERELERALGASARLIGVNQRDLRTFTVDPGRARRVARSIPEDVVKVAESGVRDGRDTARLALAGFDAVLVGEALVTASDPSAIIAELRGESRKHVETAPCS